MRYYCTFFIRSNDGDAPSKILVSDVLGALDFDDNESALNLASAERWRAAGFVRQNDLLRFKVSGLLTPSFP